MLGLAVGLNSEPSICSRRFIQAIEKQQGLKIACLEEIAYRNSWITKNELLKSAENLKNTNYGKYIIKILKNI